jgi:NAD(P)-dependent dehydrogenase (short-subunit alcohol dehydrogenase family)
VYIGHGRIINVSSGLGKIGNLSPHYQALLIHDRAANLYRHLTAEEFQHNVIFKRDDQQMKEQPSGAYSISKACLCTWTWLLAMKVNREHPQADIRINAVDPGWVKTDMGGPRADRTIEQGIDTTIWLASAGVAPTEQDTELSRCTGLWFKDRRTREW